MDKDNDNMEESDEEELNIRSLMGINYVRVNKVDGIEDNKFEVRGTVMVAYCGGRDIVYHRPKCNPETKALGECLSLSGPSKELEGYGTVIVTVNLWVNDKEIANGRLGWHLPCYSRPKKLMKQDVLGRHGSVSVGYSLMTRGFSATINIDMITQSPPPQIYGTIKACRLFGGSSFTWMLFDKSVNQCVPLNPQHSIPLTRPCFPVEASEFYSDSDSDAELDPYLTIEVDLWTRGDSLMSPDYQIALGSMQFTPMLGTEEKNIACHGHFGEIQVSLTCE